MSVADFLRPSSHGSLVDRQFVGRRAGADLLDAVVVPASRGTWALAGAVHLATALGVPLVVLCSRRTAVSEAADLVAATSGCSALVVEVPDGHRHDLIPQRTNAPPFVRASAGRSSDLSLKRNLGLLLARLHGWGKILFLDDDIGETVDDRQVALPVHTVRQIARQLNRFQVAGLACRAFPDNSVVYHARGLVGEPPKSFVSGAALGVNCDDQPLPFFPDQYNEDWFFFSPLAAGRKLAHAGFATQAPYDPFADPQRAAQEEFGDLLAEGLYALFETQPDEMDYGRRLAQADTRYWESYMAERRTEIERVRHALAIGHNDTEVRTAALRSVDTAVRQLRTLSPELCVDYLVAWLDDLRQWTGATQRLHPTAHTADAMERLALHRWEAVRFAGLLPHGRRALTATA